MINYVDTKIKVKPTKLDLRISIWIGVIFFVMDSSRLEIWLDELT